MLSLKKGKIEIVPVKEGIRSVFALLKAKSQGAHIDLREITENEAAERYERTMNLKNRISALLDSYPDVKLAILFGSLGREDSRPESDVDLAVAGKCPLTGKVRKALIADIAELTGRPVDLIDLQTTGGPVVREALTHGVLFYCTDTVLYAELIKRMIFDQADFMPYRERILAERRKAWIGH